MGTWTAAVHDLVHGTPLSLRAERIIRPCRRSRHEIADHISQWAAVCLHFDLSLLLPPLKTFSARGLPLLQKVRCSNFRHLLPRHSHNNIAVTPSFNFYDSSSWFAGVPFKFASSTYNMLGYHWKQQPAWFLLPVELKCPPPRPHLVPGFLPPAGRPPSGVCPRVARHFYFFRPTLVDHMFLPSR